MENFGPFAVAIAFWVCVGVCAVAGIVGEYKKRQYALEPIRTAVERGQHIDPAVVERLMAPEAREPLNPLWLKIGGIITCAAGVGVVLLAFFIAQIAPAAFYPVTGGGVVALCIGAGLLIAAQVAAKHVDQSSKSGA
jgi:hypothetical protein